MPASGDPISEFVGAVNSDLGVLRIENGWLLYTYSLNVTKTEFMLIEFE